MKQKPTPKEKASRKTPRIRISYREQSEKALRKFEKKYSEWETISLSGVFKPDPRIANDLKCIATEGYAFGTSTITRVGADLFIIGVLTDETTILDFSIPKIHHGDSMPHFYFFWKKEWEVDANELLIGHYYLIRAGSGYAILHILDLDPRPNTPLSFEGRCAVKLRYLYSSDLEGL